MKKIILMLFIISLIHGCGNQTEGVNPINPKPQIAQTIEDGKPITTVNSNNYTTNVFVYEGNYFVLELNGDDLSFVNTQNTTPAAINIYGNGEFISFTPPVGEDRSYAIVVDNSNLTLILQ